MSEITEPFIDNLFITDNLNELERLIKEIPNDAILYYLKRYVNKYCARICFNNSLLSFEKFMNICQNHNIFVIKDNNDVYDKFYEHASRKLSCFKRFFAYGNPSVVAVVSTDNVVFLKMLKKYGYEVTDECVVKYCKEFGKNKCYEYLMEQKPKDNVGYDAQDTTMLNYLASVIHRENYDEEEDLIEYNSVREELCNDLRALAIEDRAQSKIDNLYT